MSLRDFFKKGTPTTLPAETQDTIFDGKDADVESSKYVSARAVQQSRFVPDVDFSSASNFARYGSAEEYYKNSFKRIYQQFPYDGAQSEKVQFDNESSYLDKYIFDNVYPRTNGHAIFSPSGWGSLSSPGLALTGGYGLSDSLEYIIIHGGPNTASSGMIGSSLEKAFGETKYRTSPGANIYDTSIYDTEGVAAAGRLGTRESNLRFDLSRGASTEFWIRKGDWITSKTEKEVIFDLWNGEASSSAGYGRVLITLTGSTDGQDPFRVHLASGSSVWDMAFGGSTTTTSSLTNTWNHVGFTFLSSSDDAQLQTKFYLNGDLQESQTATGKVFGEVTGSLIGWIGALQTAPSGNSHHGLSMSGYGKLSGSLDEFRYWKEKRTSKDIGRHWFTQVGGGSNTDVSNADLGVYYKFNEGRTDTSSLDSRVLDYSGRISNGTWVGYTASARDAGSAIVSASAAASEYKDPILHKDHAEVRSKIDKLILSSSAWDYENNGLLYNFFPTFLQEEEEESGVQHLKNLTQIVGSYFDELQIQISGLTSLAAETYTSASAMPFPHYKNLLQSRGFDVQEIFQDVGVLEAISNRDEDKNFELDLEEIKSRIYQNIYNNLSYINKSKGTEKSFNNLIRCFGVDEELISINLYSDGSTHLLRDNHRIKSTKKKFINFNQSGSLSASVYQQTASGNSNTTGVTYISGTNKHLATTSEIEVIFPRKTTATEGNQQYFETSFLSSSIFGHHVADPADIDFTWPAAASDYNFELYAIRPELESTDAYFLLKDRAGNFSLTSSLYGEIYENQKWNFSVRIKNKNYPVGDTFTGSVAQSAILEFKGINVSSDVVVNDFYLTSSLTASYLTSNRRYYVGAHLTNFTGATSTETDVRATSLRHWASYLEDSALYAHAKDPENYGAQNAIASTYLGTKALDGMQVPQFDTLALNWDFSEVTSSTPGGTFVVDDFSSGSVDLRARYPGTFGKIVGNQYMGEGINFPASNSNIMVSEYLSAARQQLPESLGGTDMITVLDSSDAIYDRETRTDNNYFTFEKSLYQTISEEMLNMFGTIVEFNNLIGESTHRYRQSYKGLDKLRNLFFERVSNTPDIDKYIEYYRWIDSSLSGMLQQLVPASTEMSEGILNIIESHILERNKYRSKFPMVKEVESTKTSIAGYAENTYPWRRGHAPIPSLALAPAGTDIIEIDPSAADDRFTINVPKTIGGTGVNITIRLVSGTPSDGTANEAQVREGSSLEATRNRFVGMINGHSSTISAYGAGSGDVTNGIAGITAAAGSSTTLITITSTTAGTVGTTITLTDTAGTFIEAGANGASPATMVVPLVEREQENCFWWKERAERSRSTITSGDSTIDSQRDGVRKVQVYQISSSAPYLIDNDGASYESSKYTPRALSRLYNFSSRIEKAIATKNVSFYNQKKTYYKGVVSFGSTAGLDILDVQSEKDCNDTIDTPPEIIKKKKYFTLTSDRKTNTVDERYAPFALYSSSVETAHSLILAPFMSGVVMTNNHEDDICKTNEIPMQGPFAERFVGGSPHRHTDINHYGSSKVGINNLDSADDRIEAYDLDLSPGKITVRHQETSQPRSSFYRDGAAKRPMNIRNIRQVTGSSPATTREVSGTLQSAIGNFSKTSEVVGFYDRGTNNPSFVRAEGFGSASAVSSHVSSLNEYSIPTREKMEHIIVERFSAPGGPETSAPCFLDLESGQYSVCNNINYRNLTVRLPLRTLLSERSERFGIRTGSSEAIEDYNVPASFHKTNRNPVRRKEYHRIARTEVGTDFIEIDPSAADDRFTVNVPSTLGGTGVNITIRLVSGAPSDGTANEAQVREGSSLEATRNRFVGMINGHDSSISAYGAGSGDITNGIAGITAAAGSSTTLITITANTDTTGNDGESIIFTDVAGTMVAAGDTGASPALMTTSEVDNIGTITTYDNWYVQHPIPRSDLQYSWITGSHTSSYILGHAAKDGYYSGSVEGRVPAILFASASAWSIEGAKIDNAGINTLIYDPVSSSYARLGLPPTTTITAYKNNSVITWGKTDDILNALLLHRRGIYGFASWSPIENNSYNPIVRVWKKENTLAFNASPGETIIIDSPKHEVKQKRFGPLQAFTEPPVTSRNFPLRLILDISGSQGTKKAKIESVYGNEVDKFTNPDLDRALNIGKRDGVAYNKVKNLYLNGALGSDSSPVDGFYSLTYKQGVYPKAQNAYLEKTRSRPGFSNNFWRNARPHRDDKGSNKFATYAALSGNYSSWNMDADSDFSTVITGTTAGILQNNKTHFHNSAKTQNSASILFHLKHAVESTASLRSRTGKNIAEISATDISTPVHPLGKVQAGGGNALWQVGQQAGYYDQAGTFVSSPSYPWSDSYDDYVSELRAHNKDYSIVPEFRISEHIENYVNNTDGNFFSNNPSFLSIEGASSSNPQNSSEDNFYKIYSNSDFMKEFDMIREDHRDFVDPLEIKLTCKAIKKFVPYNGFYPSELLSDLYLSFSSSYVDKVKFFGRDAGAVKRDLRIRPFIAPLFAPGIWNNMVKSGIAVDFPIYTGSYKVFQPERNASDQPSAYHMLSLTGSSTANDSSAPGWHRRIPFEALVDPEKYLSETTMVDMFPHPSASIDVTASWGGDGDGLYKMKAHNALASMIEFFLPGDNNKGQLATLASAPESDWKPFVSGTMYAMRIKLRKSYNQARQARQMEVHGYPTPHDTDLDIVNGLKQTITICSRPTSFGPAVCGRKGTYAKHPISSSVEGPEDGDNGSCFSGALDSLTGINPAFEPPYANGESWADFMYTHDSDDQPTLEHIHSKGKLICWRFDPKALSSSNGGSNAQPYGYNNINNYSMQLTSSINIYGKKRLPLTEKDAAGKTISVKNDTSQKSNVWAIQPKMEVPILNVQDAIADIPTNGSESVPRSIWSQFGTIPTGSTGVYLEVGDIDKSWLLRRAPLLYNDGAAGKLNKDSDGIGNTTMFANYFTMYGGYGTDSKVVLPESLVEQVGFKKKSEKLGKLSKSRIVKEAIVAIPFLERNGKREFFEISKDAISTSLSLLGKETEKTNSVIDMVSKMKEYILPPRFDFVKYPEDITPFAMYIFEFKHKFDQDDLSYIWQGIQPRNSAKMQLSEASIEHRLLAKELMGKAVDETDEPLQSELRWMVFKVKQKAPTNYYEKVVRNQSETSKEYAEIAIGRTTTAETDIPEYSYNWPYDYFSLVEFAKIDAEVKFAPEKSGPPGADQGPPAIRGPSDCPPTELATAVQNMVLQTVEEQK